MGLIRAPGEGSRVPSRGQSLQGQPGRWGAEAPALPPGSTSSPHLGYSSEDERWNSTPYQSQSNSEAHRTGGLEVPSPVKMFENVC